MLPDMTRSTFETTGRLGMMLGTALLLGACTTDPDVDESEPSSSSTAADDDSTTDQSPQPSTTNADDTTTTADTTTDDQPTGEPEQVRSFVLVHGSWMGAWSWERVVPELEGLGHEVRVVELPAHGDDRGDPARASLDGYRDVVLAAMDDAGEPVVLVGHSMGGMVISAAAQARPQDVEALVYVAGYLPADGQSLLDLAFMDPGSIVGEHLIDNGDGTTSLELDAIGEVFCGDCSAADVALLQDRHRPEPGAPLATPITLTEAAYGTVPRVYVRTAQDQAVSPTLQDQMLAATPVDAEATVETAHAPMLTDPAGLGQAIVGLLE